MSTNSGMKDLIHVVNKLQDVFTSTGISSGLELPQIAVVGGQSAGKSSVLENFVGKDFLPRGNGIVTRRPLILQLIYNPKEEFAEFLHTKGKFHDFKKVRKEIEDETDRETGSNKGISRVPIHLRVNSPNVLDLTLIDLPGLTKVAVGDQPEDIEYQIRSMLMEYISSENTLILAVSPANQDLANSDALKLARKVDPQGNRTIGVLTKLDLMDKGTDARDILENKHLPLKKGYIGIVNRSQIDIDNKKDIHASMQAETEFFLDSPYKTMVDRMGTKYLQKYLNEQLGNHIKDKLPGIRSDLNKKLVQINAQLKELGYFNQGDKIRQFHSILAKFTDNIQSSIEGNSIDVSILEAKGGAIIHATLYGKIFNLLQSAVPPPTKKEISLAIANTRGFRNIKVIPELAFDVIVRQLIDRYKSPLQEAVVIIKTILCDIVEESSKELDQFPKVREEVQFLVSTRISKLEEDTTTMLMNHVEAQKGFVNTKHPEFLEYKFAFTQAENEDDNPQSNRGKPPGVPPPTRMAPTLPRGQPNQSTFTAYTDSMDANEMEVVAGKLTLMGGGFRSNKEVHCIITTKSNLIVMDDRKIQINQKLTLKDLQCESKDGRRGQHFILDRSDGQPLFKSDRRIELACPKEEAEPWINAFKAAGIYKENRGSTNNLLSSGAEVSKGLLGSFRKSKSNPPPNKNDIHEEIIEETKDYAEGIRKMVKAYMKITETTIQDIVPKYILFSLVTQTIKYVKEELMSDLLSAHATDEEREDLMQEADTHEDKIEELVAVMNATKEAVHILEQMSQSHRRK